MEARRIRLARYGVPVFFFTVLALALAAPANAAWPPAGVSETAQTANAKFPGVKVTAVTLDRPLPASFGPHPAACDKISFVRMRRSSGPVDPAGADQIFSAQPGIFEGASAFLNVGSATVTRSWSEQGKNVEFWAIDRRSNCLEDVRGLEDALANSNASRLIDYYYRGASVGGHKFAGFLSGASADGRWLAKLGLDQTLRDWNEINTRILPNLSDRQAKLFCGGHSLGGMLTGTYADYDFDGDPATLADAGYNQCRAFFGLDTTVTDDAVGLHDLAVATGLDQLLSAGGGLTGALLQSGVIPPFLDIPGVLNPEVMFLLTGVGAGARLAPTSESQLVKQLPANTNVKLAYRTYFSRDAANFISGTPGLRDFRMTGQALLGTFMDDNSQPLSIVQTSTGFFDGGPVVAKNFPFPNDVALVPGLSGLRGLLGTGGLAIPSDPGRRCVLFFCWYQLGHGPLYRWRNYDALPGATIPRGPDGRPFTDPSREVSDIDDVALALSAAPLNFIEAYFPLKLAIDVFTSTGTPSSAAPGLLHPAAAKHRPVINIMAGDGPMGALSGGGSPSDPVIPGYQHLDVLTAAPVQNNGQPEGVVTHLLQFAN